MRTTLQIDDDVLEAARTIARRQGKSIGFVLSELARKGLRPEARYASVDEFPIFEVREGAPIITPGDVRRGLDDQE